MIGSCKDEKKSSNNATFFSDVLADVAKFIKKSVSTSFF